MSSDSTARGDRRQESESRQESTDAHPRAVMLGVAGVIATVLLVAAVAGGLTRALGPAPKIPAHDAVVRAPRLQSDPRDDIAAFELEKRSALNSYGWIDSQRTVAHIPIERAMQALAAQSHPGAESR